MLNYRLWTPTVQHGYQSSINKCNSSLDNLTFYRLHHKLTSLLPPSPFLARCVESRERRRRLSRGGEAFRIMMSASRIQCSGTHPSLSSLRNLYMHYPQLAPLSSISIPGDEEVPAPESASSLASPPSQPTPLLDYLSGMCD